MKDNKDRSKKHRIKNKVMKEKRDKIICETYDTLTVVDSALKTFLMFYQESTPDELKLIKQSRALVKKARSNLKEVDSVTERENLKIKKLIDEGNNIK